MNSIFEIAKYKLKQIFHSGKYIAPLLCFIFLLFSAYLEASNNVIVTFSITLTIQYIICVWFGFMCNDVEDIVIEQLLYLKVNNRYLYYLSETMLFFCLAFLMTIFVMLYPAFQFLINPEIVSINYIYIGLILHISTGMMGLATGSFFHPCIIKKRKTIVILILLVLVLSFIKSNIFRENPVWSIVSLLLPPMSEILYSLKNLTELTSKLTFQITNYAMTYYLIQQTVKVALLIKRKF